LSRYGLGSNDERDLIADARAMGCMANRAAGSKGQGYMDIYVSCPEGPTFVVNSKRNLWAPPEERTTFARWSRYGVIPYLACCIIQPGNVGRVWYFRAVDHEGRMGPIEKEPPWQRKVVHNP
jgi:hypothetical protein